jgi:hypothetical protein
MKKLALIIATLLLGACGGSHHHDHDGNPDTPPVVPPVTMLDSFYSAVLAIVGNTPEDSEPPRPSIPSRLRSSQQHRVRLTVPPARGAVLTRSVQP